MAYAGTTAASTAQNVPRPVTGSLVNANNATTEAYDGYNLWIYNSTHSTTQLTDSNFFSDAYYVGMRQGDVLLGTCNTGSSVGVFVGVLGAVTTDGAALASTGGILSSTR